MSLFHSLAWQEFLDDLYSEKRDSNLKLGINPTEGFIAVYSDPNYEEAKRLADLYILDEDYLANSEGLQDFLRNSITINPNYQINGVDCIDAIIYVLSNSREYFLPPYRLLYNKDTEEPYAYNQIVEPIHDGDEDEGDDAEELGDDSDEFFIPSSEEIIEPLEFPVGLNFRSQHSDMLEMWSTSLSRTTQERILSLTPYTEQVRELFRLKELIDYEKFQISRITLNLEQNINRWINKCVEEYKKGLLLMDLSEQSIRNELNQFKNIVKSHEINMIKMNGCYSLLGRRFIHEVKILRKGASQKKKAQSKIEWNDFYDLFISKTLPANPKLMRLTLDVLKSSHSEAEFSKALSALFEAINSARLF